MTTESQGTRQGLGTTVADAAGTIKSAASDAADHLPEVASATRTAFVEVDRQAVDTAEVVHLHAGESHVVPSRYRCTRPDTL